MGGGVGEDDRALIKECFRLKDTVPLYLMFLKRERELEMNKTAKETKIVYSNLCSFDGSIKKKLIVIFSEFQVVIKVSCVGKPLFC